MDPMNPLIIAQAIDDCIRRLQEHRPTIESLATQSGDSEGRYKAKRAAIVEQLDKKLSIAARQSHADATLGSVLREHKRSKAEFDGALKIANMLTQELSALQSKLAVRKKELEQVQFGSEDNEGTWDNWE